MAGMDYAALFAATPRPYLVLENVAVRCLPATGSLNVCGDRYDVIDLSDTRFAVAVGDVVGHGLEAAAVMGMPRSALSAATRALERPPRLWKYWASVPGRSRAR